MKITCFYHADCVDGFAAWWAVKKRWPQAEGIAVDYNQPVPCYPTGMVVMVDFTVNNIDEMRKIINTATYTVHLDHHEGASDIMTALLKDFKGKGRYYGKFDNQRSGAGLAWDHFHREKRPELITYVEDRDLWKFQHPSSEHFNIGIRELGFELSQYDFAASPEGTQQCIETGRQLKAIKLSRCDEMIHRTLQTLTLEVGEDVHPDKVVRVWASRALDRHDASEQCGLMLRHLQSGPEIFPIVVVWWPHDGGIRFRLSSSKHGPNVIPFAKAYGGGGHPHASGIHLELGHPLVKQLYHVDLT